MDTLLLNKSEVESLIDPDKVLTAVENGYRSFNSGQVVQPDFMSLVRPGTHVGFDFKAGMDMQAGFVSMKSSSGGYKDNTSLVLPTGLNMVYLYDAGTSALKCIMDGTFITRCRTAAAGAVSVKYMARKDAHTLAIIGAGGQARWQMRAILRVRNITAVTVWSYTSEHAAKYAEEMQKETGITVTCCKTPEDAVRDADIIVTTTIGRRGPVLNRAMLKKGTHIAAIGSDMPDKQELNTDIFRDARLIVDSVRTASRNGETHHALDEGVLTEDQIAGEIGEVILGRIPGRTSKDEITVFDTCGMAIQDNAMAVSLYKEAVRKHIGASFDFLG